MPGGHSLTESTIPRRVSVQLLHSEHMELFCAFYASTHIKWLLKKSPSNFLFSLNTVIFGYLLLVCVPLIWFWSWLNKYTESYLLILSLRDISLASMINTEMNILVYLLVHM